MNENKNQLKRRIKEEMTINYKNILEKNFDFANKMIKVSEDGRTDIIISDKDIIIEDQILLYLIGKLYAKEVGYIEHGEATRIELLTELGISENSIGPILSRLKDKGMIKTRKEKNKPYFSVKMNLVRKILNSINDKFGGL